MRRAGVARVRARRGRKARRGSRHNRSTSKTLRSRHNLPSVLKVVQAKPNELLEVLTVIDLIELLATHNHTRHRRNVHLNLVKALLINILVLQKHVDILKHLLTVEARHLVDYRNTLIGVRIRDYILIGTQVLADIDHVIRVVAANHDDLNASRDNGSHFYWYTWTPGPGAVQFLPPPKPNSYILSKHCLQRYSYLYYFHSIPLYSIHLRHIFLFSNVNLYIT